MLRFRYGSWVAFLVHKFFYSISKIVVLGVILELNTYRLGVVWSLKIFIFCELLRAWVQD